MFKKGSIRKLDMKNFVYIEFFPGPNLNMLIGPNGTGKSTVVAAIILGLGGNPKVVGRGTKVSEYVKHGCEEATINIYLQAEDENDFLKITRKFTKDDKSCWFLNNKSVKNKDILTAIEDYNIQVDNLCQFLPQDKVQDFAKLNQQDLLHETQLALCRNDLLEKRKELIETRDKQKKLIVLTENNRNQLQQALDANARLEAKVENFNKRREYCNNIQDIDRKIAWLQYEELYYKMGNIKEDVVKATKIYDKYKNELKPVEDECNITKETISDFQQRNSNLTKKIKDAEANIRNNLTKLEDLKQNITNINQDKEEKIHVFSLKQSQIQETKRKIDEMQASKVNLLSQYGSDRDIKEKVMKVNEEIKTLQVEKSRLVEQKEDLINNKQEVQARLRAFENELLRLEDVKAKRLENLRRIDNHAYQAVLWLRNNKHLFKGEVYEPIILELNMLNPQKAIYVENVIPKNDRIAFTCVLKEDMNALIHHLRNEQKLTVNVLHSPINEQNNRAKMCPSTPIEHLRPCGFYTYLNSLFTVPEPILAYLCKIYKVHEIPVGDQNVNKYFQDVPKHIRLFFSDTQRYSVTTSRHTGEKSIRQSQISAQGHFSTAVDVVRLLNLQGQIRNIRNSMANFDENIQKLVGKISSLDEKIKTYSDQIRSVQNVKQEALVIENRIKLLQQKIDDMNQNVQSVDEIQKEAKHKILRNITAMATLQDQIKTQFKTLTHPKVQNSLNRTKIEIARRRVAYLESQVEEIRERSQETEQQLKTIKDMYADIRANAKVALQKAKGMSDNFTPDDDGFAVFRPSQDALSSNLPELYDRKKKLQYKIDCLVTADDDEMQEYDARQKEIGEKQSDIERGDVEISKVTSKINKLRDGWLTPLKQLITEINGRFSEAFQRMNCAGQVELNAENEEEYAEYGLSIKVSYRAGEPLQELNRVVQSGGERAVATAVFMLSLQELTPVPFRCVDEINQGMDANNERRIFELLVECTSQVNTSQYFLITPKLVPNLKYSHFMMIHVVHNGPFVEQDRKWSSSKLCNPQGVQLH